MATTDSRVTLGKGMTDAQAAKLNNTYTKDETRDRAYIDGIVTSAAASVTNYETQAALLAYTPTVTGYTAKALDTKKIWYWNGSAWVDTGLSELDLANKYTDTFDSLKINAGKSYPLKQLTRNGITSAAPDLNNVLLNVSVQGADKNTVYKIDYYSNGTVSGVVSENSWRISAYNKDTFKDSVGTANGVIVVDYADAAPAVDRTKINTILIKSVVQPELSFLITIDGSKLKPPASYNLSASVVGGWSWIIDESCYVYRDSVALSKITALEKSASYFPVGSPVFVPIYFDAAKVFKKIEFWGLSAGESVYLRTLYNYFYNTFDTKYYASIGFNSSLNQHITIDLAPQSDIAKYAHFVITGKLLGVATYFLYRNGDSNTPAVGLVTIDWDEVKTSITQRFTATDNSVPLVMPVVNNSGLSALTDRVNNLPKNSPFAGKKIGIIGDSITWGFTPRNDPSGVASGTQLSSYLMLAATALGMTAYNYGISGSTLGSNSGGANSPMTRRTASMRDDLDVIGVMGGTNDVRKSVGIGVMSDRVDTTFYGALHVMCQALIDKYYINQGTTLGKTKQIVLLTPIKLQTGGGVTLDTAIEPYVQAVKDVGAYYAIPVLDMYNRSGITPHISQTVVGTETGYTQNYNVYITDGTHPTQQGHVKMANALAGFLKTLV